jgi:hypothetical protein
LTTRSCGRSWRPKIRDEGVLWLVDRILESGEGVLSEVYGMVYFPGDTLFAINRPRGLPIGNQTSQFWGNVILSPVDHFAKRELRCPGYVRYVDDLLVFGDDKRSLWEAKRRLVERLETLRLAVHTGAHPRPVQEGIPFLGFVVFPERRRLKRRKGVAFRQRLSGLAEGWRAGEISRQSVAATVESWENHARYGNTTGLRKAILKTVPPELRELLNSPGTAKRSPP